MKVNILGDFYGGGEVEGLLRNNPQQIIDNALLDIIQSCDLSVLNLESPLTGHSGAITKSGPAIKSDKSVADFLKHTVSIDLVTLANNHILDYGRQGLKDTLEALNREGISYCGAGMNNREASKPFIFEQREKRLAILNFCENEWSTTFSDHPGANPIDEIQNYRQIVAAKQEADYVLVIAHGGHEHYSLPSPRIKKLFRFYAEAGANAVVGHHPHCVSGYEIYNNVPIIYSVGNFLFYKQDSVNELWNQGMMVSLNFTGDSCRFDLAFFDQCNGQIKVVATSSSEKHSRIELVERLNEIIADDERLNTAYNKWRKSQYIMYEAYLEPHSNRYLQFLQRRKLLPSLWSKRKRVYLQNLIRCEAHRDVVLNLLEDENSYS